jgi:HD-GYP domain-containing protein (c-di-GMP phosphodiesterase class II)
VTLFADLIAEDMGLTPARRRWIKRCGLLHDIGKLGVSNQILDKPGKLDDSEWQEMKRHAELSERILSRISAFSDLAVIAGGHHERPDGKGYPRGLTARQIPLETRIISTADVFDALTAERPYRGALPISQALSILAVGLGTATHPDTFAALARAMGRVDPSLDLSRFAA